MLTQLSTVKMRLGLLDATQDTLLTYFIEAASARFEKECNRAFGRTVDATHEFAADSTEIIPARYPIESVSKFEMKETEADGWVEQTPDYYLKRACVISLLWPMGSQRAWGRIAYTGGFVLPGTAPGPGQTALPKDLESAAVEQVAAWYLNKDKVGLIRHWPSSGTYLVLSQQPLLPTVSSILRKYLRWTI